MTLPLGQTRISIFHGSYNATPMGEVTLAEALAHIGTGVYRHRIERLRQVQALHGKKAYTLAKKHLPAVTFCGTFSPRRARDSLTHHSGLIHLDYDGVPDVAHARSVLCVGRCVVYAFSSPSGMGLKVGIHIQPVATDAHYKHAWSYVAETIERHTGLQADSTGTDVSRLCYLSWDPHLYVNLAADILRIPPPPPPPPRAGCDMVLPHEAANRREQYLQQAVTRSTAIIETSSPATPTRPGTRHYARLRAGRLLGGYVAGGFLDYDQAYSILEHVVLHHTRHYERSMQTIASALEYGMRTPVTFQDLEQERLAWCAARGIHPRQEGR